MSKRIYFSVDVGYKPGQENPLDIFMKFHGFKYYRLTSMPGIGQCVIIMERDMEQLTVARLSDDGFDSEGLIKWCQENKYVYRHKPKVLFAYG